MVRHLRHLILIMGCLFLTACVAPQSLPSGKALEYKRVGVLSAMGKDFSKTTVGFTVFGNNDEAELPLDLDVDEVITRKMIDTLSSRYEVIDLSKYRQAFFDAPKTWYGSGLFSSDTPPTIAETVDRLMGAEGLDAYILVTPSASAVSSTNQAVAGVGLVKHIHISPALFADYYISVVDGTTRKMVADASALPIGKTTPLSLFRTPLVQAPSMPVSRKIWKQPEQHQDDLKRMLDQIMASSLPETLRRIGLIE